MENDIKHFKKNYVMMFYGLCKLILYIFQKINLFYETASLAMFNYS